MAGNETSISTTMKVNDIGGPQESRVNAVSLWCHGTGTRRNISNN